MKLMVKKDVSDNRWDPTLGYESLWFSFLKPFSLSLWVLVALLIWAASMLYLWVEEEEEKSEEDGTSSGALLNAQKAVRGLSCLGHSMHRGTFAFFAGGDLGYTKTRAGSWIRMGFAVFAMVMISTYTANLAQLLVVNAEQDRGITGIEDCDPPSSICEKVCIIIQQRNLLHAQHPTMEVVTYANSGDLVTGLANGDCQAAVVPEHDVRARLDYQESMCENGYHLVGDPIFTVYTGFAARADLINALSYYMLTLVYQGEFRAAYDQFRYKKIDTCLEEDEAEGEERLTALDMGGVCILFAIVLLISFCMRLGSRVVDHQVGRSTRGADEELTTVNI